MRDLLRQLHQKPIAYYPIYRQITGSTTAGILLSQLMYWFSKQDKIFKTDVDIMDETLLTEKELRNAKKLIKSLDFIEVTREGIPAKTYYKIKWDEYENCLKSNKKVQTRDDQRANTVTPKGQNCTSPKGETNIVKSLTENTTENTTEKEEQNNTPKNITTSSNTHSKTSARKNQELTPFNIINFYRQNISKEFTKIKEQKSFNLLALKTDELQEIFTGLQNYAEYIKLKSVQSRYIASLKNFIEDKTYLDFKERIKDEWTTHAKDSENLEWR